MGAFYFDTSALVKRYVQELGSIWTINVTKPAGGHEIFTVLATAPEMIAAFFRKVRIGQASLNDAVQATLTFKTEWQGQYRVIPFTDALADQAMLVAEKHGLRGYDSVHLAAAIGVQAVRQTLSLSPLTFVSSDASQLQAAAAEGLSVENPGSYP